MTGSNWVVRLQGLEKSFLVRDRQQRILSQLTIDVSEGEFLGIVGASGTGKTTLLNMIARRGDTG